MNIKSTLIGTGIIAYAVIIFIVSIYAFEAGIGSYIVVHSLINPLENIFFSLMVAPAPIFIILKREQLLKEGYFEWKAGALYIFLVAGLAIIGVYALMVIVFLALFMPLSNLNSKDSSIT